MPLSSGLLAFYKLADATDFLGDEDNDLTATGGATFGAGGKIGNALILAGGGQRCTSTSPIFALDGPVSRTFAGWLRFDSIATSPGIWANFAGGGGGVVQYLLWHDSNKLKMRLFDASNGDHSIEWPPLDVDTWYFVVVTYNATTGLLTLNVDNGTPLTDTVATVKEGTTSFELGNRNNGGDGMAGKIDAFGVWNRVLTGSEQTTLFNNGDGLEPPFTEVVPGDTGIGYGWTFF